jgi:DNA mismatch repair ATPase MutL
MFILICLSDLEELLSLMHDRPIGQMVRCSKVRAMFASRACRKSIMIGDSLNRQQMVKVRAERYELVRQGLREPYRFSNT